MSMVNTGTTATRAAQPDNSMGVIERQLLQRRTPTYTSYYAGKMSYAMYGKSWEKYISEEFPDMADMTTSENVYKAVIDLYAENLVPMPDELRGFSNVLVPLLSRGEAPVVVDSAGVPHFPEHYEMISDGKYTVAAIFTRSLEEMQDYVTFAYSDGRTRLFQKAVPTDFSSANREGYVFVEEQTNNTLFRFALDDKGFGASLSALQDRINHSILDQTIVEEMYARPFWYLLKAEIPAENPYLPKSMQPAGDEIREQRQSATSGRIFTTPAEGPFGQLEPPTIADMIAYHDSVTDKVSTTSGIPQFYFKPGAGAPPTGVALKVLSKRFNNKIARMRDDIEPAMKELAGMLGVEKTLKIEGKPNDYELWNTSDDLLQESLDAHGIALSQMGYPLGYIAEVVTPGVDLDDYADDTDGDPTVDPSVPGTATDMTAMGQPGLPATPGQVQAYAQNPGQRAAARK